MDFSLSAKQQEIVACFREFAQKHFTIDNVRQWSRDGGLPDNVRLAFVQEYYRHPELAGFEDSSGSLLLQTLVNEELCRVAGASLPFASDIMHVRIMQEFSSGHNERIASLMDHYRHTGRLSFSIAVSEPGGGSDTYGMQTAVTLQDGRLVLNGRKTFVENGEFAPYVMVAALDATRPFPEGTFRARDFGQGSTSAQESRPELSFWLVPIDAKGVRAVPITKIGQKILPFADISFENVELDPSWRLVSDEQVGFKRLFHVLEIGRTMVCAQSVGLAQAALEDAVAHAKVREAFGQRIALFGQIATMLVDMEVKVRTMRAMTYEAAWAFDQSAPDKRLLIALMKRYVPRSATEVASDAMQILGGRGYTSYERASWIWEDCRGNQIADGTDQIMVRIAGPLVLDSYDK